MHLVAKYSKDDIVIRVNCITFASYEKPMSWNKYRQYRITEVYSSHHKIYMIAPNDGHSMYYYEDRVSEYIIRNKADYEQYCLEWEHRHLMSLLKQA